MSRYFFDSGRDGGFYLLKKGLKGVMEYGVLQKLQHVLAEVEGKKLGECERDGDVVLQGIKQRPEVFAIHPVSIQRKPCCL